MYQFFVEQSQIDLVNHKVHITGNDVNHIANVLRMKQGEEIAVSNGTDKKEYRCAIARFLQEEVECDLLFVKEDGLELSSRVFLFQGLPKQEKMELIIQKAVELGAYQIIPVAMKRCVVKLDDKKSSSKVARWNAISEAAAKQSKRRIVPEVTAPMSFSEAVKMAEKMQVKLLPYELSEGMEKTKERIEAIGEGEDIAIFIGPEGGFDDAEVKLAKESGIEPITLGRRILRTETAGFTILSWIMYHLEK